MSPLRAAALLLACAGCAVAPAPAWKSEARDALDAFTSSYLAGDTRAAQRHFGEARAAVAATGRADLVARVELVRCAVGTAALDAEACAAADAMRAELADADRAYAEFLEGNADPARAARLPEQYQPLAQAADDKGRLQALAGIADPVSRLVAAGALFRGGRLPPQGVAIAVETASDQAWRHPLLAYLNVQASLAETAGDTAMLEAVRKRLDLVADPAGRRP